MMAHHRRVRGKLVFTHASACLDNRGLGCGAELELDAVAADSEPVAFVFKGFDDADRIQVVSFETHGFRWAGHQGSRWWFGVFDTAVVDFYRHAVVVDGGNAREGIFFLDEGDFAVFGIQGLAFYLAGNEYPFATTVRAVAAAVGGLRNIGYAALAGGEQECGHEAGNFGHFFHGVSLWSLCGFRDSHYKAAFFHSGLEAFG